MIHAKILRLVLAALVAAAAAGCDAREPAGTSTERPAAPVAATPAEQPPEPSPTAKAPTPPVPTAPVPTAETPVAQVPVGTAVGTRLGAFKTKVERFDGDAPRIADFDSQAQTTTTMYIVSSTTCPYTKQYLERIREVENAYMPKGVDVVYVYSNRKEADKREFHTTHGFRGGFIDEKDAAIVKILGGKRTPEIVLADRNGVIVYRGGIDDNPTFAKVRKRHLVNALDQHLAGTAITVTETQPFG